MKSRRPLFFVHLFNDYSGSPRVLFDVIEASTGSDFTPKLFLGSDGDGLLSSAPLAIERFCYRRYSNKLLTLGSYLFSQISLFTKLTQEKHDSASPVIYINTLLPFGAAIYGRLTGCTVIYHVHEVSIAPPLLNWFLKLIAEKTADRLLMVSHAQIEQLGIHHPWQDVRPNCVSPRIYESGICHEYAPRVGGVFRVLMLASLRAYKGLDVFVNLARELGSSTLEFHLVVNDEKGAVDEYRNNLGSIPSLFIHHRVEDPSVFYKQASLLVNLSYTEEWIETFGLTIAEAFCFGVPVIAPPVGGPVEIVTHDKDGWLIDSRDLLTLKSRVMELYSSQAKCLDMSINARATSRRFSPAVYKAQVLEVLNEHE